MIKNTIRLLKISKYFNKNKISINEVKKYLKKKGFEVTKRQIKEQNNLGALPRTFLTSVIIISIFSIIPSVINLTKKNIILSKDFENNSKNNLKKVLNNQDLKLDEGLNKNFNFEDILQFDEQPSDTVRLSASTIEELFKSTNYNLTDVRKNKLVKPIRLTLLPKEIKQIENSQKRKDLFIQIILPLVIKENNYIKLDRKKLFSVLNKSKNTRAEKNWLMSKFKQYGVVNKDLSTLKIRMDEVPVSMAIAQAAKETGWGTSRFAQEGNALFGQWTWSGEGLKPKEAKEGADHKVMKFNILQASVRAYQRNLNTHSTYKDFRKARAEQRDSKKPLDSIKLSKYLNKYAETGNQYVDVLQKIIMQNKLQDFDDAKLLPSSSDLESLI